METELSCKALCKMEGEEGTSCARPIVIEDSPLRSPIKITMKAAEYRELNSDTMPLKLGFKVNSYGGKYGGHVINLNYELDWNME